MLENQRWANPACNRRIFRDPSLICSGPCDAAYVIMKVIKDRFLDERAKSSLSLSLSFFVVVGLCKSGERFRCKHADIVEILDKKEQG